MWITNILKRMDFRLDAFRISGVEMWQKWKRKTNYSVLRSEDTHIFWCRRARGKLDRSSFMQYCRVPRMQFFIYSSKLISPLSVNMTVNNFLSTGESDFCRANILSLWNFHLLVVKNCRYSRPIEIRFWSLTMLFAIPKSRRLYVKPVHCWRRVIYVTN